MQWEQGDESPLIDETLLPDMRIQRIHWISLLFPMSGSEKNFSPFSVLVFLTLGLL